MNKKIYTASKRYQVLRYVKRIFITIAILAIALYILIPILWGFLISIKSDSDIYSGTFLSEAGNITSYRYVEMLTGKTIVKTTIESTWKDWKQLTMETFRYSLLNSFLIGVGVTLICVFFGALASYSFAKQKTRAKNTLFTFLVLLRFLPYLILLIPIFQILLNLHLINTRIGLTLVYSALTIPLVIWILKSFFETIPNELLDAARIDGASGFRIIFRVILPVSLPAFATAGLIAFVQSWQEFLLALVLTSSNSSKTIPVAIAEFHGREGVDLGMLATGTMIAIIPIVAVAFIAQKYIVKGLTTGAVME